MTVFALHFSYVSIKDLLKETWNGYNKHRIGDLAAMMTYYVIFALFPFAVFLVTIVLLVLPQDVLEQGFKMLAVALPGDVSSFWVDQLHRLESSAHGGFAIIGFTIAIWSASRGAAALQTALNEIHEVKETRSWLRVQVTAIGITLLVSVLILVALALLIAGPAIGHFIVDRFGLGAVFDWSYNIGRWIVAALLVMFVWACLYYFLPNIKRKFRWVTPGAIAGVLLWLLASRGFILYTDLFGSYDKTYGTLGGVIVFLTWLWLSCMALLIGGEIDDAMDEVRKEKEGPVGEVPVHQGEGKTAFPITPEVGQMKLETDKDRKKEIQVERETRLTTRGEPAITDLARRVGDDLSTLAKDHFELARIELTAGAKRAMTDGGAILLSGIVALIGLAMLCTTLVVAVEPVLPALWLRLLLGSILYIAVGGVLCLIFIRKLGGDGTMALKQSRVEAKETVKVLKEQVHNG
jgi:membrane protein